MRSERVYWSSRMRLWACMACGDRTDQAGQFAQFPHCRGDAFDLACPRFADGRIDEGQTGEIRSTIVRLPAGLPDQLTSIDRFYLSVGVALSAVLP